MLDTFVFVGSMENYDTSFRVMMELIGADPYESDLRRLAVPNRHDPSVASPPPHIRLKSATRSQPMGWISS